MTPMPPSIENRCLKCGCEIAAGHLCVSCQQLPLDPAAIRRAQEMADWIRWQFTDGDEESLLEPAPPKGDYGHTRWCACGQRIEVRFNGHDFENAYLYAVHPAGQLIEVQQACPRCGENIRRRWHVILLDEPPAPLNHTLVERLDQLIAMLDQPAPASPTALDEVDTMRLLDLSRKHLGRPLADVIDEYGITPLYTLPDFPAAAKAMTYALADHEIPVQIHRARTLLARNRSLYLSLDYGFGSVALFGDHEVNDVLHPTAHLLVDWRTPSFAYDFVPPLKVIIGLDSKNYPRILEVVRV